MNSKSPPPAQEGSGVKSAPVAPAPAPLPVIDGESTQIYKHGSQDELSVHAKRTDPPAARADERTAVFRVPPELLALSIQSMNEGGAAPDPQALLAAGTSAAVRPNGLDASQFSDEEHTKVTPMNWPRGEDGEPLPLPLAAELLAAQAQGASPEPDISSEASIELHESDRGSDPYRGASDEPASDSSEFAQLTSSPWRRRATWLVLVALAAGAAMSISANHGEPLQGWVKRIGAAMTR